MTAPSVSASPIGLDAKRAGLLVATYIFTTVLSACLLFLVQPIMAKLVLPLLGGSSSVWAVTTVFFQSMLLLGYGYAHGVSKWLSPLKAIILHVLLLCLGFLLLNFDVVAATSKYEDKAETVRLLLVLLSTVGVPFAVMSANAPLMQKWFSLSGHKDADEPYFLYAASNFGSISALLLYPALLEPLLTLSQQTMAWSAGFAVLAFSIFACGIQIKTNAEATHVIQSQTVVKTPIAVYAQWLALSFLPAALLSAITNFITIDIAAVPFLWLPPLVLYLASFIFVFRPVVALPMHLLKVIAVAVPSLVALIPFGDVSMSVALTICLSCFFAITCICHRKLYETRPPANELTSFYVVMSFGGVLGSGFVAFAAPVVFSRYSETPLLLALAPLFIGSFGLAQLSQVRSRIAQILAMAFGFAGLAGGLAAYSKNTGFDFETGFLLVICCLSTLSCVITKQRMLAIGAAATTCVQLLALLSTTLESERNFYGVLTVIEDHGYHKLMHGSTIHGAIKIEDLKSGTKPSPITYYGPDGGMAQSIVAKQAQLAVEGKPGKFAVVGLGSGSLACYSKPGETWRFFEINKAVTDIARNPKYFNFLEACAPTAPVIHGDARLTLQREAPNSYDVLIIDAFSSDSIPVHLMTVEAMRSYLKILRPNGTLVFHVSNRHLSLAPVLKTNAQALSQSTNQTLEGLVYLHLPDSSKKTMIGASNVVIMSYAPETLASFKTKPPFIDFARLPEVNSWTDDYSNVLSALLRLYQKRKQE